MNFGSASKTSPNMKKFFDPLAFAAARICGENFCQNSRFTCLTVSIRKPSMPISAQVL